MADAEELIQLREMLTQSCRSLHELLVRGTLIGWPDVPIHLIGDLAATRAQIERTQTRLRQYGVAVADCTGELVTLRPLGLMVSEPALKQAEEFWTTNRYDEAVSVLRAAYATKQHDPAFTQRYLHYWYMLGIRAMILGQLLVAYHAVQEVVHLDPGYKHAAELLRDLEQQRQGEPLPAQAAIELPTPRPLRVEARADVPYKRRQVWFSVLPLRGSVLIAVIATLIAVVLFIDRGRWIRTQTGTGPVPAAPVTTVAPVIAPAPLPTARPTVAPAETLPPTPTARSTATPTALPPPTSAECGTRRVSAPALQVRDAPLGKILHTVYQGTRLILTCETQTVDARQWVKIQVTTDPTIAGWVRADFLEQP